MNNVDHSLSQGLWQRDLLVCSSDLADFPQAWLVRRELAASSRRVLPTGDESSVIDGEPSFCCWDVNCVLGIAVQGIDFALPTLKLLEAGQGRLD